MKKRKKFYYFFINVFYWANNGKRNCIFKQEFQPQTQIQKKAIKKLFKCIGLLIGRLSVIHKIVDFKNRF